MKLPRLITRRRLKWVGTVLCVLLLGVYVASAWRAPALSRWVSQTHYLISIERGRVSFESDAVLTTEISRRFGERAVGRFSPGIDFAPKWGSIQLGNTGTSTYPAVQSRYVLIPIWPILLLLAAPTAWLWHTDRRAEPWQCAKCRYDLRGLEGEGNGEENEKWGGVCPECGTPTQRKA